MLNVPLIPVLLTSSVVAHDAGVALTDTAERVRLTLRSIEEWLKIRPHAPLVVCDGASYDFTNDVRRLFPDAKQIECLAFENPQALVQQFGRGYGEGEIVRYALAHSRLIQTAGAFAKCSAKLWVANFDTATAHWNGRMLCKGIFLNAFSPWKPTTWLHIDTRFYVVSNEFYSAYFQNAHHDLKYVAGSCLEDCFKSAVQQSGLHHVMFQHQPIIEGTGGGIGRAYRTPWHRRVKEQLRLSLVRRKSQFAALF